MLRTGGQRHPNPSQTPPTPLIPPSTHSHTNNTNCSSLNTRFLHFQLERDNSSVTDRRTNGQTKPLTELHVRNKKKMKDKMTMTVAKPKTMMTTTIMMKITTKTMKLTTTVMLTMLTGKTIMNNRKRNEYNNHMIWVILFFFSVFVVFFSPRFVDKSLVSQWVGQLVSWFTFS